jgi:hypothetical protein
MPLLEQGITAWHDVTLMHSNLQRLLPLLFAWRPAQDTA